VIAEMDRWLAPDGVLVTLVADEQLETARELVRARRVVLTVG
jgi:hypothetical protein